MVFAYNAVFKRVDVYKSDKYDFARVIVAKDNNNISFNVNNNVYGSEVYKAVVDCSIPSGTLVQVKVDFVKAREHNYYYCNLISITALTE